MYVVLKPFFIIVDLMTYESYIMMTTDLLKGGSIEALVSIHCNYLFGWEA